MLREIPTTAAELLAENSPAIPSTPVELPAENSPAQILFFVDHTVTI
jgi:hypothetical protein